MTCQELKDFNLDVDIMDPYVKKYLNEGLKAPVREPNPGSYDELIAVAHEGRTLALNIFVN